MSKTRRMLEVVGLIGGVPLMAGAACGNVEGGEVRQVVCNGGPVDVLPNGSFDASAPAWRQDPPNLLCGQPLLTPDSGAAAACLGGGGDGSIATLSQDILLPEGAVSARLVGRICIATQETQPVDSDIVTFDILDGMGVIGALGQRTNRQGTAACAFTSFTLDTLLARDPELATFRVQSTLDAGDTTSFYIDTLTLTVQCR